MSQLTEMSIQEAALAVAKAIINTINKLDNSTLDMRVKLDQIAKADDLGKAIRARLTRSGYGFARKCTVELDEGQYIWLITWPAKKK